MKRKERKQARKGKITKQKVSLVKVVAVAESDLPKKIRKVFNAVADMEQLSRQYELDPDFCDCEQVVAFLLQVQCVFKEAGIHPRDAIPTNFDHKIKTEKARAWVGFTRIRLLFLDTAIDALTKASAKADDNTAIGEVVVKRAYPYLLLAVKARCVSCFSELRHTCPDCHTVI